METLLRGRDLDRRLNWPNGKANRLARAGCVPHIRLPDGQIRFDLHAIEHWLVTLAAASLTREGVAHADLN